MPARATRPRTTSTSKATTKAAAAKTTRSQPQPRTEDVIQVPQSRTPDVIHVTTDDDADPADAAEDEMDMDMDMEEVHVPAPPAAGGEDDEEDLDMEPVDVPAPDLPDYAAVHQSEGDDAGDQEEEDGAAAEAPVVFYDGKGQPRGSSGAALSLTFGNDGSGADGGASSSKQAQRRTNIVTPRDRATRLATHKLHLLSLLAHAQVRNAWLNHDPLRDYLYACVPPAFRQKLRAIHPKREPAQRERVRMFEAFLGELVRWWAVRFYLDPDMSAAGAIRQPGTDLLTGRFPRRGRRVDGWVVESEGDREDRHERQRGERQRAVKEAQKARERAAKGKGKGTAKGKGKARANETQGDIDTPRHFDYAALQRHLQARAARRRLKAQEEITIFPPGPDSSSLPPAYLRLLPPPEPIRSPADLLAAAERRAGSRETSAQLFCALCRALGVPARLVVSPQVAPWSVAAGKVAQSVGAVDKAERGRGRGKGKGKATRFARKPTEEATSDDDEFEEGLSLERGAGPSRAGTGTGTGTDEEVDAARKARNGRQKRSSVRQSAASNASNGTAKRPVSVASGSVTSDAESARGTASKVSTPSKGKGSAGDVVVIDDDDEDDDDGSTKGKGKGKGKGKATGKAKAKKDEDYRDDRWKGIKAPLEVEFKPKLRSSRPVTKETALEAQAIPDVDPIDLTSPPTMWVEVFSKPFQKWLTVDPVRARVSPVGNRQMEPLPQDRANKLVYVVAFEEDGYARDVTARYTKTLHSRVSRMRPPPPGKGSGGDQGQDWWEAVARALHRPQQLERDAAEDAELADAASKEPMPNSVGGFKDHPVFALERHLRRDEAIHPYVQVGTFQGIPVFHRRNVTALRSARQWYNEGRVVSPGMEPLKWVKSRGYTLANRRAEEAARAEGMDEPQEGLYARFQTAAYAPPPVTEGKVPKNHFGNIDLYVPSMLPPGGAHIPFNGAAKAAKKLGVDFAEAIVGFEFRKHRSMPRMGGIVVPLEAEDAVLDAYWAMEHAQAEREMNRKQERAVKHWRKILNALRIAKRVQEQYGKGEGGEGEQGGEGDGQDQSVAAEPGGFLLESDAGGDGHEGEAEQRQEQDHASHIDVDTPPPAASTSTSPAHKTRTPTVKDLVDRYSYGSAPSRTRTGAEAHAQDDDDERNGDADVNGGASGDAEMSSPPPTSRSPTATATAEGEHSVADAEQAQVAVQEAGEILSLDELARLRTQGKPRAQAQAPARKLPETSSSSPSPSRVKRLRLRTGGRPSASAEGPERAEEQEPPTKRPRRAAASAARVHVEDSESQPESESDVASGEDVDKAGGGDGEDEPVAEEAQEGQEEGRRTRSGRRVVVLTRSGSGAALAPARGRGRGRGRGRRRGKK